MITTITNNSMTQVPQNVNVDLITISQHDNRFNVLDIAYKAKTVIEKNKPTYGSYFYNITLEQKMDHNPGSNALVKDHFDATERVAVEVTESSPGTKIKQIKRSIAPSLSVEDILIAAQRAKNKLKNASKHSHFRNLKKAFDVAARALGK